MPRIKAVRGLLRERARDTGLKEGPYAQKITGEFVPTKSKQGLNYQLFGNPKWDGTQRFPLVIWLHGSGQSGDDNKSQMGGATKFFTSPENQSERACFMIAPQCPVRRYRMEGQRGYEPGGSFRISVTTCRWMRAASI